MNRAGLRAGCLAIPALAAALALARPADARPYTVDDLIAQESFGQVAFDPTGRWLVYERRVARTRAHVQGLSVRPDAATNQLRRLELGRRGAPRPLIAGDPTGVTLGPFAPDGQHVAVYRLQGRDWRLGVVEVASGRTRWFPIVPEYPYRERTVQWLSPTHLVAIARPAGTLPLILRIDGEGALHLPERWRRAAAGETMVTALGSGRAFGMRPQAAASGLVRLDVRSGRADSLAEGEIEDLEVSPDARRIAFRDRGPDIPLADDRAVAGEFGSATRRARLGLIDLVTGAVLRPLPQDDLAGQLLSWSPAGDRLLVFARPDGAPWSQGRPLVVQARGVVRALPLGPFTAELTRRPEVPRAVWLGETPAILARRGDRLDWIALADGPPRALTRDLAAAPSALQPLPGGALGVAQGRAWRLTSDGAEPVAAPAALAPPTSRGLQIEQRVVVNSPTARRLGLVITADASGPAVLTVDAAGGARRVALPGPDALVAALDPVHGAVAVVTANPQGVEALRLWRGGAWTRLDTVNAGQADVNPLSALAVSHRGRDGSSLTSYLYLPARAPGSAPPALIVVPYPGQSFGQAARLADYNRPYMTPSVPTLVGAGYAVLTPSLPLAADAEPAAGLAAEVLAIVDAAAVQHAGAFDPSRLALWGHSFGGYGTMVILTQTDRFRAAVETSGPANLASIWGTFQAAARVDPSEGLGIAARAGWVEDAQARMGAPPWRDPARYVRNSPVFQADRIRTPLMLVTSDHDHVPASQAEEMFSALYRQDRDAVLLTYWGESHVVYAPGPVRDLYGRALAWIAENLVRPVTPDGSPRAHPEPASATSAPNAR